MGEEQSIQKCILDYLNMFGVAVKVGLFAGKVVRKDGKKSFMRTGGGFNGGKGFPDVVFIHNGKVSLIEVKSKAGSLRPDQILFKDECEKQKVEVHVAKELEDVVDLLERDMI